MKRIVLMLFALVVLPALALAQPVSCPTCIVGIYDDVAMNKNFGTLTPFVAKDLYLGVTLREGQTGITQVEFSILGLLASEVIVTAVDGVTAVPPNILIGNPPAPADTTTGTGGMNAVWGSCQTGSEALLKISILPVAPTPNRILRVTHHFPPSNLQFGFNPILIECDSPTYTAVKVTGGCYVMNYDGVSTFPGVCDLVVGVEPKTWSSVKKLYD